MSSFLYTNPNFLQPNIKENEIRSLVQNSEKNKWILIVAIGTKPDFYKQAPLIFWANKKNIPVICATTGQHFDELLGFGIKEFKINPLIDFQVRGDLLQKSVEIFYKVGALAKWLRKEFPNRIFLPIPHGDTLTAAIVSSSWFLATRSGVAQNEAGLRGMNPVSFRKINLFNTVIKDVNEFIQQQWNGNWETNRAEPWPEQWDTFVAGAGSAYFYAPCEINKTNLLREGYPEQAIRVVGNSVVDAVKLVPKPEQSIFDVYPALEKYNDWIRVDVHRRGNLTIRRFHAIVEGILDLVKKGMPIIWCELTATKRALEYFNLRTKVLKVNEKYKNFIFTPLWREYGQVIEFWKSKKCFAELTDSGSIQEELNEIKDVLCLTLRFNTDRPESVFTAKSNILVPPGSAQNIVKIVSYIRNDNEIINTMKKSPKIYGNNVSEKIMDWINEEIVKKARPFQWVHERLYGPAPFNEETVDFM